MQSPPVQAVLRSRIRAGMERFSRTMRREFSEAIGRAAEGADALDVESSSA